MNVTPSRVSGGMLLAIDQGTSSTKAIVLDGSGTVVRRSRVTVGQEHPQPGWVEQDPAELLASVLAVAAEVIDDGDSISGLGLSTQRESALIWDRRTGEPLSPLISWQDRRTAGRMQDLAIDAERVRALSGLPLDAMFSALKIEWLLDRMDPDRRLSRRGEIVVGTLDAWLVTRLTGQNTIEAGNASRTQLLNVQTGQWDEELLALFRVPRTALPDVVASNCVMNATLNGRVVKLGAVLADSHAALFAHGVVGTGEAKVTLGSGSSIMGIQPEGMRLDAGLSRTIAWSTDRVQHAYEANILSTGATAVWLSRLLGMPPEQLAELAYSAPDSGGVDLVPAFAGLGAPWWDPNAQALIAGLTLGSTAAHLARAAFDSISLQIVDVLDSVKRCGLSVDKLFVDGGPSANDALVRGLADLAQVQLHRSATAEVSAVGAAQMAGETLGVRDASSRGSQLGHEEFDPSWASGDAGRRRAQWWKALTRARAPMGAHAPL